MVLGLHQVFFSQNWLQEGLVGVVVFIYILSVVYGTKLSYGYFKSRNLSDSVAKYYNRKIIHIFAGGVPTIIFSIFFSAVTIPLILVFLIALLIYIPHKTGKLFYWFQVKENMYEVNFVVAWGMAIGLSWVFTGTPLYGVVPAVFMSFGDGVTGIVRNTVFKKRTKSWLGNIAMLCVCIPIGYYYVGWLGIIVAIVASVAEHFEFGIIDDNILITISSFIALLLLVPVA